MPNDIGKLLARFDELQSKQIKLMQEAVKIIKNQQRTINKQQNQIDGLLITTNLLNGERKD